MLMKNYRTDECLANYHRTAYRVTTVFALLTICECLFKYFNLFLQNFLAHILTY